MAAHTGAIIGIDLGTYNSVAAVLLGGVPVLLVAREGRTDQGTCFPSFVEFDAGGEVVRVGEHARRSLDVHPERVVWGTKRLIGKSYREVKKAGDLDRFQYRVVEAPDGGCRIVVGPREYTPTEISSFILRKIKEDAEADFNPIHGPVTEATITVPAYFGPLQKAGTERAATLAGFAAVHLIPEPTAAALAYKVKVERRDQFLVVTDLGAGTFDVTAALLYLDSHGTLQTNEKGHGGDTALGGLDIDDALFQHAVKKFGLKDVARDPHGRARLRLHLEQAKIALSEAAQAEVDFAAGSRRVSFVLTRPDVEAAAEPVLRRCGGPIDVALREAGLEPADVSHLLLVGGPTKMPAYRRLLLEKFRDNPAVTAELTALEHERSPIDPMEAVGLGAVLGKFGGITPHAYGLCVGESTYYELIPRGVRYPCSHAASTLAPGQKRSLLFQLIQKEIDPTSFQEVYALLAFIQFDYRPEPGQSTVQIEATYSANGILDLKIIQPSSMVSLPLFGVSKLAGTRIPNPMGALPIAPPVRFAARPPAPEELDEPPPVEEWTEKDLQTAILASNRLRSLATSRLAELAPEERAHLQQTLDSLAASLRNTWEDPNTRAPRIRNLNRALVSCLIAGGALTPEEVKAVSAILDQG